MKVKIKSEGLGLNTEIEVDGKPLDNVKALKFESVAGGVALLTLTLYVDELEIVGDVPAEKVPA